MRQVNYDDVYYAATLVEFIGRHTMNKRGVIAKNVGLEGVRRIIDLADVNHCLSIERVSEETIERYGISMGGYDTITTCKYKVPSCNSIGAVYAKLATSVETDPQKYPEALYAVLTSELADKITNFNTAMYYTPSNALVHIYQNDIANA